MKFFMNVVVLTICTISTLGKVEDWDGIKTLFELIAVGVGEKYGKIRTLAKEDNPAVAESINPKVDHSLVIAKDIVNRANESITKQTLSEREAKVYIQSLKNNLIQTEQSLMIDDLDKLSPEASDQITLMFVATFSLIQKFGTEVVILTSDA